MSEHSSNYVPVLFLTGCHKRVFVFILVVVGLVSQYRSQVIGWNDCCKETLSESRRFHKDKEYFELCVCI